MKLNAFASKIDFKQYLSVIMHKNVFRLHQELSTFVLVILVYNRNQFCVALGRYIGYQLCWSRNRNQHQLGTCIKYEHDELNFSSNPMSPREYYLLNNDSQRLCQSTKHLPENDIHPPKPSRSLLFGLCDSSWNKYRM